MSEPIEGRAPRSGYVALLGWTNVARKRKQAKDHEKYGVKGTAKPETEAPESSSEERAEAVVTEIPSAQRKLKGKRRTKK